MESEPNRAQPEEQASLAGLPADQRVDAETWRSLLAFRREHPPRVLEVGGARWRYVAAGQGDSAVLFLHGMGGELDIWWRQIEHLAASHRVISVSFPLVDDLQSIRQGIMAILDHEGLRSVRVIGSSLGGYVAQYLLTTDPDRIDAAVLANTYPPNDLLARVNRRRAALVRLLPARLFKRTMKRIVLEQLYRASGHSGQLLAYFLAPAPASDKHKIVARYRCACERFEPPDPTTLDAPLTILACDNDPLIPQQLTEQLQATYPAARVEILSGGGHMPYLSQPERYTARIERFLRDTSTTQATRPHAEMEQITLRVDVAQIAQAHRAAEQTGVPYQSVLRHWLAEGAGQSSVSQSRQLIARAAGSEA